MEFNKRLNGNRSRRNWQLSASLFSWAIAIFCFFAALFYILDPIDPSPQKPSTAEAKNTTSANSSNGIPVKGNNRSSQNSDKAEASTNEGEEEQRHPVLRTLYKFFLLLAIVTSLCWFIYSFTGDPDKRTHEQIKFSYAFMLAAFTLLVLPPLVKSQAIGSEPIGIISGCVLAEEKSSLHCGDYEIQPFFLKSRVSSADTTPGVATTKPIPAPSTNPPPATAELFSSFKSLLSTSNNQWIVNIGGALSEQNPGACLSSGKSIQKCKLGSINNRAFITGGLAVPLPVIIIALAGGAISLSRRVPEYQKRADKSYVGTESAPKIQATEAREYLAFQIMQFLSAPLIAIAAYQLIDPVSEFSVLAVAFMAGFGSETILLMIRGVAEGIRPRTDETRVATGQISGKVVEKGQPVVNAVVKFPQLGVSTNSDANGGFFFSNVKFGQYRIDVTSDKGRGSENVSVTSSGITECTIDIAGDQAVDPVGQNNDIEAMIQDLSTIKVRLTVDDSNIDPNSLEATYNGSPIDLSNKGFAEISLITGEPARIVGYASRSGVKVMGLIEFVPTLDDQDKPLFLEFA